MKKSLEIDAADLQLILENLQTKLPKMSEADMIDLAARLKPVAKSIDAIDKHVKEHVKTKLRHKEGSVLGGLFKACLKLVPAKRLDQSLLKADDPELYESYCKESIDERITFDLR